MADADASAMGYGERTAFGVRKTYANFIGFFWDRVRGVWHERTFPFSA